MFNGVPRFYKAVSGEADQELPLDRTQLQKTSHHVSAAPLPSGIRVKWMGKGAEGRPGQSNNAARELTCFSESTYFGWRQIQTCELAWK